MPRSYDLTPTQITHHPTQRIDPVPGRLPDIKPEDLINGFSRAMKMLTGVDITSSTAFFEWLKERTGLDFVILGRLIDSINNLLGIDPDNPIDIQAQWLKIKQEHLDPISDFLTPDSPLNGANLFGLLDLPFVMLRNTNQELLENATFFGELAVGNRSRWSHSTTIYREDNDPPGAETALCDGSLTAIRSNRGKVAEGQKIVGEIHVLGNQVLATVPGSPLMRLQLISYLKNVQVGTPVTVGLTSFTLDPTDAGWVGAPSTALAGRLELDWTVPAGVDEVLLRTELTENAASGRVHVDSGSLQRGFNWYRVERDLRDMLGILDGIASPDHWEAAYLGLKDLLSLVGIDTSGWVTSTAFDFWRNFNTYTTSIVQVFVSMGSVVAWENAWDGLRGLATMIGLDTSDWPDDLDPGGLLITFAALVTAGNALFKDLGNKAKWTVAWNALRAFIDKLLGPGVITWPTLEPGGGFVDALGFVQNLIGDTGRGDVFPQGAGGVIGQVPTGLRYNALPDLGASFPSGNVYYRVTAVVGGAESPPSAEVLYWATGFGTVGMKVRLDWNAFEGATQYRVYRRILSVYGDVDTRLIATVVGTTFTDQTIRAGGSTATPPVSVDLAAQAAAEAAAEAAAAAANALVTTADSTVPNAPTWGLLQGVVAEVTSADNSVPYPGLLQLPIFYHYTVTAVTAAGKESVASAEKFVMISPLCPAQVKITWTASTTPSTTYRVYRRSSKTGATLRVATGVTGTTFTDTAGSGITTAVPGTTAAVAGAAVATTATGHQELVDKIVQVGQDTTDTGHTVSDAADTLSQWPATHVSGPSEMSAYLAMQQTLSQIASGLADDTLTDVSPAEAGAAAQTVSQRASLALLAAQTALKETRARAIWRCGDPSADPTIPVSSMLWSSTTSGLALNLAGSALTPFPNGRQSFGGLIVVEAGGPRNYVDILVGARPASGGVPTVSDVRVALYYMDSAGALVPLPGYTPVNVASTIPYVGQVLSGGTVVAGMTFTCRFSLPTFLVGAANVIGVELINMSTGGSLQFPLGQVSGSSSWLIPTAAFTRANAAINATTPVATIPRASIAWSPMCPFMTLGYSGGGAVLYPDDVQMFTTSDTWIPPTWWRKGVDYLDVVALGGGGSGGTGATGAGNAGSASSVNLTAAGYRLVSGAGGAAGASGTTSAANSSGKSPGNRKTAAGRVITGGDPASVVLGFPSAGKSPGGGSSGAYFGGLYAYGGGAGGWDVLNDAQPNVTNLAVTVGTGGTGVNTGIWKSLDGGKGLVVMIARQNRSA